MKASKENIINFIASRQQERKTAKAEFEHERASARAKIEELKQKQVNAETSTEYRNILEQIHEQEDYISFLEKRAEAFKAPAITREEYNDIADELKAENEKLLEVCAPKIVKKFDELLTLMEDYSESADSLQEVLNIAQTAYFGSKKGGHFWHTLKTKSPDNFGYFAEFCQKYFDRKSMIKEIKEDKRKVNTFTNPEQARIFANLHRVK